MDWERGRKDENRSMQRWTGKHTPPAPPFGSLRTPTGCILLIDRAPHAHAGARCSGDLTDVVGNVRVALANGLGRAGGGVFEGLMLHLGIELGPEQDDEGRDPEPH